MLCSCTSISIIKPLGELYENAFKRFTTLCRTNHGNEDTSWSSTAIAVSFPGNWQRSARPYRASNSSTSLTVLLKSNDNLINSACIISNSTAYQTWESPVS